MTSLKQQYKQLLEQTQSFLLQEYACRDSVMTTDSDYAYFKEYFLKTRQQPKPAAPLPSMSTPIPATTPKPKVAVKPSPLPSPSLAVKEEKAEPTLPPPSEAKKGVSLEPMPAAAGADLKEIRKIISEKFPHIKLHDNPPDDSEAKQRSQRLRAPEVVFLSFHEPQEQALFLGKVCRAVDQQLAPAVIYPADKINKQNKWEAMLAMKQLSLIVATDVGIHSMPKLKELYRESSNKMHRYLGGVPLLLLPDLTIYLKQPELKRSLWKALQQLLKNR
ncbi:MAG: hypothetical protein H7A37_07650 [Chlamydiales bacterium]|nr:hypothetical protein [Chlamydiia bacterium]MCP5508159.1 hypothetical protein [Chlamydiales bacterium]